MAIFKVKKRFKDIHTKDIYEENAEIEMTVKRSKEVESNLDSTYLERIDDKEDEKEEEDAE